MIENHHTKGDETIPYKNKEDRKKWEQNNKDKLRAADRRFRSAHPDRIKANNAKRTRRTTIKEATP